MKNTFAYLGRIERSISDPYLKIVIQLKNSIQLN